MSDGDGVRQPGLEPLTADEWGEAEYAAFGALLGVPGDTVPRAGSGHAYDPLNFTVVGLLARHPDLARAILTFNVFLLRHGSLPPRLRELAILRVTHTRRSAYLWEEHVRIAVDDGMSDDDIARLADGNAGFEGADRLVLEATDEMLAEHRARPRTWQDLVDLLGTHQAMELVFVVGTWAMLAMAFETWGLAPKPDSPAPPASGSSQAT